MSHLHVIDLVVVLLHVTIGVVAILSVAFVLATFSSGLDTNILSRIRFLVELVSEVLGHDAATIFIVLLTNDGLELLADCSHDLLEAETHGLVSKLADISVELLVNLLDDAVGPGGDLVVGELDLLIDLFSFFIFLLVFSILPVELSKLGSELRLALRVSLVLLLVLIVVHLQFLELLTPLFVVLAKFVDFGFILTDILQQLGVGLLTS